MKYRWIYWNRYIHPLRKKTPKHILLSIIIQKPADQSLEILSNVFFLIFSSRNTRKNNEDKGWKFQFASLYRKEWFGWFLKLRSVPFFIKNEPRIICPRSCQYRNISCWNIMRNFRKNCLWNLLRFQPKTICKLLSRMFVAKVRSPSRTNTQRIFVLRMNFEWNFYCKQMLDVYFCFERERENWTIHNTQNICFNKFTVQRFWIISWFSVILYNLIISIDFQYF